jgi:amino acid adenylation domain-containing protein
MSNYLIQHYLENTARINPGETAIIDRDGQITNEDLDLKSNQIANLLHSLGFETREVTGVFLNKSIEAIVAFHGVLKAGGCYIPLDAVFSPLDRVYNIIKLSELKYIISNSSLWQKLYNNATPDQRNYLKRQKVVFADNLLSEPGKEKMPIPESFENCIYFDPSISKTNHNYDKNIINDDLAYILYTSGSTGIPKGVMITHSNAITFIDWAVSYFKPSARTFFSCHAPLHFDLSVFDIYVSIATNGCVTLVPFETASNPKALIQWISEKKINYWYSVPSVWVAILNYAGIEKDKLSSLKNILFAGEVFPPKYLKKLMNILPDCSFFNLYGPTETNVCTYYRVQGPDDVKDKPVPIGLGCENTEVLALNEKGEPIGENEEGELLVRGAGVTKGYYKNPETTKAAFMTSPLPYHHGGMLYKTGDTVRKSPDGFYEYVGRRDFMVKVAGFRVELQEIEHVLLENPIIEEAVLVSYYYEERGNNAIGAFVKLKENEKVSIIDIKKNISSKLPNYMVPEIIFKIDEIPKNTNGKIDRVLAKKIFQKRMEL